MTHKSLFSFENYVLDVERRELRHGTDLVAVQPQVFDLLEYLIRNRERVVSKDDLIADIWGGRIVSESALTTRINAVRTAIGDNGRLQRLIRTVSRKGFRFVGILRELPEARIDAGQTQANMRPSVAGTSERRQLTVMCCELIGPALSSGPMDPEDVRNVEGACQRWMANGVSRFGGFVARSASTSLVVLFGYPAAQEDDTERAVQAALALCGAVASFHPGDGRRWQCRIGIATGLVMIRGAGHEGDVVGEALGMAARLQALAPANALLIEGNTRELLGNLFEYRDLGAIDASGIGEALQAWQVTGEGLIRSRFEAMHPLALSPLVGREDQLNVLAGQWARAKTSDGRIVLISGEPGIGKSRLVAEFQSLLPARAYQPLHYFCLPILRNSAFGPVVSEIEQAAGFERSDKPGERFGKLVDLLARTGAANEDVALLADLLSLPPSVDYPLPELSPLARRERTFQALGRRIAALAHKQPVLLIFEDLHWIDPTSLEFLNRVWTLIVDLPVLVLATYRPEFSHAWVGLPHVTLLALSRLGQREGSSLVTAIAKSEALSRSLVDQILERSDGIPLFIEELTKTILEAPVRGSTIPNTLQALLMARLDQLGPAKEVAQIGAAIGRAFSGELISLIASRTSEELTSALDRLVAAGLLVRQGVPPDLTYVFKHALVQDAAYGSLLREPRRKLHARIAAVLANRFPDVVESQPELLARHYSEAALRDRAASCWANAGYRSLVRSALVEASKHFTRALAEAAALPGTTARRRDQLNWQLGLVNALMHTKGYASPDTKASLDQARLLIQEMEAVGEAPEDPLLLFSVLYGFWVANHMAFKGDVGRNLAAQFLAFAEKQGATVPLMIGHRVMGTSLLVTGEFAQGRAHLDQSIALYEPAKHRPLAARFGQDNRVATLSYRSLALWGLGFPQASLTDLEQLLDDAHKIGQAASSMYALFYAALILTLHGEYTTATARADELAALADKSDSLIWKASGMAARGTILTLTSKASEAVHSITSGLESFRSAGGTLFRPFFLSHLAHAHAQLGQLDDAWRCIGEALAAVQSTKESWYEADVHRIAGEVALSSPNRRVAKAEAHFERALGICRAQNARTLELRAAMSRARLWLDLGKRCQAYDLLAPVHGSFTESFDTLDFRMADALLRVLRPG